MSESWTKVSISQGLILKKIAVKAMLCSLLLVTGVTYAGGSSPIPKITEGFRFVVTPYLWTPSVSGTVDYQNTKIAEITMSSNQILKDLNMGGMLDAEVHYGRWGLIGNATFAKLKATSTKSNLVEQGTTVNSKADAWLGIYTVAGTYTAYAGESLFVDVLAGARFLNLNTKTTLDVSGVPSYNKDTTLYSGISATNAVGGVQGRVRIGESKFFVPFYLDAGGGSALAKFTSQQILGVGYTFDAADVLLVYNNLYYNLHKDSVSAYINMGGPAVAATFRF